MDEFTLIKVMNEATIRLKKSKNEDCTINETIKSHLEDEAFFFKISKSNAIKILASMGVAKDRLESTYQKLTDKNIYDKLANEGKLGNKNN